MLTRLTFMVDNARRRLSGKAVRVVKDDENALSHTTATATTRDDEVDGDEIEYDNDEETSARDAEIEDDAASDVEGDDEDQHDGQGDDEDDDHASADAPTGHRFASVEDLFGPGELERRLAEEAAGVDDDAMTVIEDDPALARIDAQERMRLAADEEAIAAMSEEDRAAVAHHMQTIMSRIAEDRRLAEEKARSAEEMESGSDSDSDSGSDSDTGSSSTSNGSDSDTTSSSSDESDDDHDRDTTPPPPLVAETPEEARQRSPTPDMNDRPPTEAERIKLEAPLVESLVGAPRTSIFRVLVGRSHDPQVLESQYGPLTPVTSRESSPSGEPDTNGKEIIRAPIAPMTIPPEMAAALTDTSVPRNRLRRFFDGDYFIRDGDGGLISARTQRHVTQPFERTHEENRFFHDLRDFERARDEPMQQREASEQQSAQPESVESPDVDMEDYDSAASDGAGDCSSSDDEGMSSQHRQPVQAPVTPRSTPPRVPKRARSVDDDDAEMQSEKRRRVVTEEQPGSPRPRANRRNNRNHNGAGSSSAATRSTLLVPAATSTAPQPRFEEATVAVYTQHTAHGSDETSMPSTSAAPIAGPSQAASTRKPRTRTRAGPSEPTRRSSRIKDLAQTREELRAAAAAAAVAEASPHKTHRGTRGGKRNAKAKA